MKGFSPLQSVVVFSRELFGVLRFVSPFVTRRESFRHRGAKDLIGVAWVSDTPSGEVPSRYILSRVAGVRGLNAKSVFKWSRSEEHTSELQSP